MELPIWLQDSDDRSRRQLAPWLALSLLLHSGLLLLPDFPTDGSTTPPNTAHWRVVAPTPASRDHARTDSDSTRNPSTESQPAVPTESTAAADSPNKTRGTTTNLAGTLSIERSAEESARASAELNPELSPEISTGRAFQPSPPDRLDRADILEQAGALPLSPEEQRTDNGSVVMNESLLAYLNGADRRSGADAIEVQERSGVDFQGGQWSESIKLGDRCFQVIWADPLDSLSQDRWYRVRCRN